MKIAGMILDIYDDIVIDGLQKIASLLPDDILNHNLHESGDLEKLSDDDFAAVILTENDNKLRRYPIDSREETIVSNIYFGVNEDKFHKTAQSIVAKRIVEANKKFNIETCDELQKLADEAPEESWINLNKYPMQKIKKVVIREIEKTASPKIDKGVYGDGLVLESEIVKRSNMIQDDDAVGLRTLYDSRNWVSPESFCDGLKEFDKKAGISQYWGSKIRNPEAAVFYPKKEENIVKVGSAEVPEDKIKEIAKNADALKTVLTDEMVDEFQKDPITIFKSLPFPTQNLIISKHGTD